MQVSASDAFIITAICLFSTGHPIGGAIALFCGFLVYKE